MRIIDNRLLSSKFGIECRFSIKILPELLNSQPSCKFLRLALIQMPLVPQIRKDSRYSEAVKFMSLNKIYVDFIKYQKGNSILIVCEMSNGK
jgi:hypothetical protein